MTTQYYFLVSSLPMLRFGAPSFLSSAHFLALVAEHAGPAVAEALARITLLPGTDPRFAAEKYWYAIETHIRNYLLRARCDKPLLIDRWSRPEQGVHTGLDQQLHKTLGAADPLERERQLDQIRWELLEEALFGETFTVNALVVYRLRLLLAEKWQAHATAAGREVLMVVIGRARDQAQQKRTRVDS